MMRRPSPMVVGRGCPNARRLAWLLVLLLAAITAPVRAQADPPPEITIDQMHLFVMPLSAGELRITEYYLLGNTGDTAYSDAGGVGIVYPLPEGATDIRFDEANDNVERYTVQDGAIADTMAIPSGSASLETRFSYAIPYEPGRPIVRQVPLPVQSAVILMGGGQFALEGDTLAPLGAMEVGGQSTQAYTVDPLNAGDSFSFAIVRQSTGAAPAATTQNTGLELVAGGVVLGAAAVVSYVLWRSPAAPQMPARVREEVAALARLDARYAAGELAEDAYQEARAALKARIKARL